MCEETKGNFIFDRRGETLIDLEQSGCLSTVVKRQSYLKSILNGFGIEERMDDLHVHAALDNFAARKHNLLQAMLR